jgi:Na+-transporting NADH:ubiquinone oxidoreductase subunit NqrF
LRVTRPGGLIVITVPALKCLWSDWDVSLHHYRRYGKGELLRLLTVDGAEVLHCVYTNAVALPAMLIVRGLRRVFPSAPKSQRAEDRIPPATLNRILRMLFTIPAKWKWFRPPVGASLLAVIRRR